MHFVSRIMLENGKLIVCLIVVGSVLAVWGLLRLSFDVAPNAVFMSDNVVSRQLERLYDDFGHEDNEIVIVLEGDSLLEPDGLAILRQYRDQLAAVPKVVRVGSLFDLRERRTGLLLVPRHLHSDFDSGRLKNQVTEHPIGKNQLVSQDGRMLVLVVRVAGKSLPLSTLSEVVADVQQVSHAFEAGTGIKPLLAGHLVIRAETLQSLRSSMLTGTLFATLISAIVALFHWI